MNEEARIVARWIEADEGRRNRWRQEAQRLAWRVFRAELSLSDAAARLDDKIARRIEPLTDNINPLVSNLALRAIAIADLYDLAYDMVETELTMHQNADNS